MIDTEEKTDSMNTDSEKISFHIEEYKMLREEIVAYMDKLQQVRNMMYVAVAAILGFSAQGQYIMFISLLALLVVCPSYACAIEYWEDVRKISAYLAAFHENSIYCPYHWESRNKMFHSLPIDKRGNVIKRENWITAAGRENASVDILSQLVSYYCCAVICIGCFVFTFIQQLDSLSKEHKISMKEYLASGGRIFGIQARTWILICVIVIAVTIVFFMRRAHIKSYEEFLFIFTQIRNREKLTPEGMNWKKGSEDIQEILDKYRNRFNK